MPFISVAIIAVLFLYHGTGKFFNVKEKYAVAK
jgi:uncharacterized membrane protein YphA (DoxX/SURF4 family)